MAFGKKKIRSLNLGKHWHFLWEWLLDFLSPPSNNCQNKYHQLHQLPISLFTPFSMWVCLVPCLPFFSVRGKQRLGGSLLLGAFLVDLFVLEMQGSKFGTFLLSVFRNLVRENGWRRDCQCFFSAFKCSQQHLLCRSGEWCNNLSSCACVPGVPGVGNGCGSVDRGKLEWRDMLLFPPLFFVFHNLAPSSGLGSIV